MALIAPTIPTVGQPNSSEDGDIVSSLNTIVAVINGGLDSANLATPAVSTATIAASAVTKAKLATDALNAFLKLVTPADVKVAFGTGVATYLSSSVLSATVTHGMGITPQFVAAFIIPGSSLVTGVLPPVCTALTGTTQFSVAIQDYTAPAFTAPSACSFAWLALG